METGFQVDVRTFEWGTILDLQGDMTKEAEEPLLKMRNWEQGLENSHTALVLNFTQTPYINSAGIAILIRIVRAGAKGNYRTFAYGVTSHYQKLFRMVGLTAQMLILPDEYAVLQRIGE